MKRLAIFLAAVVASPVLAGQETDYPHRDWGRVAILDMSATEATTCVAQGMARMFERILPIPAESGTDIDAGPGGGLFGVANDPWMRLKVRGEGGLVTLRVFYRHPVSQKRVGKIIEKLQERCLRVRSIDPA